MISAEGDFKAFGERILFHRTPPTASSKTIVSSRPGADRTALKDVVIER
jgi:hypothetical protein